MTNDTQQTGGWKTWSEKTWVVVVAGLFLPPVGMALAWLKPDWSSRTKWIATCLMGLLLIGMISADNDENSKDAAPDSTTSSAEITTTRSQSQQSQRNGSEGRSLPKVSRSWWGPKTLAPADRYVLLDSPDECKGNEYRMEVKYKGGAVRLDGGRLEDLTCQVWTGGTFFDMDFTIPPDVHQPNITVGDYLILSFVYSGSPQTRFTDEFNIVTEVERPSH